VTELIETSRRGPIGLIALNRPDKLNAVNDEMVAGLHAALDGFEADDSIQAIILHGNGRSFSAGFDMELGTPEEWQDRNFVRGLISRDFDIILRFWRSPKPTIAAVHGHCLGSALELAIACDLTVATEGARFGAPEVVFGSGIVAMMHPTFTAPKRAKEMLLLGRTDYDSYTMKDWALVNEVVDEGEHLDKAFEYARIIAGNDANAVRMTKAAINRTLDEGGFMNGLYDARDTDIEIEFLDSPEKQAFNAVMAEKGPKAAVAWRRAQAIDEMENC
jgi:enoyl-CoA hydratase